MLCGFHANYNTVYCLWNLRNLKYGFIILLKGGKKYYLLATCVNIFSSYSMFMKTTLCREKQFLYSMNEFRHIGEIMNN